MVSAAKRAGLPGQIHLVHEPEAAAILCFAEEHEKELMRFEELRPSYSANGFLAEVSEAV